MKVYETGEGRVGDDRQLRVMWIVDGSQDTTVPSEAAARKELIDNHLPRTLNQNADGTEHWLGRVDLAERVRNGIYRFTATYWSPSAGSLIGAQRGRDALAINEWTFSWDTQGNTRIITQSHDTAAFDSTGAPAGSKDDLHGGLINVVDGEARGVEAVRPSLSFRLTCRLASGYVLTSYLDTMAKSTGTVNDAAFPPANMPFVDFQWAANEVLFVGGTGSYSSEGTVDVDLSFRVQRNKPWNYKGNPVYTVKGHDEVWHYVRKYWSAPDGEMKSERRYSFVETIYEQSNFNALLGIGGP